MIVTISPSTGNQSDQPTITYLTPMHAAVSLEHLSVSTGFFSPPRPSDIVHARHPEKRFKKTPQNNKS